MMKELNMTEREILDLPYKRFIKYQEQISYYNMSEEEREIVDNTYEKIYGNTDQCDNFKKQIKGIL